MALPLRPLTRSLRALIPVLGLALAAPLLAQAPAGAAAPLLFRTVSVDIHQSIGGLFYDHPTGQIELTAGAGTLSSPYPCPPSGIVSLYRQLPPVPPETEPRREPVVDVRLGPGGPWLVFLSGDRSGKIHALPFEQSWDKHPANTVRIFNFTRTPVAIQAGGREARLTPTQSELMPYPEEPQLWLKVAIFAENQWALRNSTPQRILPGTRATWLLLERPPTRESPEPRIVVRHLVEPAPPAPPAPTTRTASR